MKKYLIYDGRYHSDPDSAMVMSVCDSLKEAERDRGDYGTDCVIEENECQHKNGSICGQACKTEHLLLVPTGKVW